MCRKNSTNVEEAKSKMGMKHLSSIANDVLQRCAQKLDYSVEKLVEEFEAGWKADTGGYSRKLVEFCSAKTLSDICVDIEESIRDGSFSRLTFDMMLAWEMPSAADEESCPEGIAKGYEDVPIIAAQEQEEIPLFYSDILPLLVDNEPDVGEDAFVWLGSLVPLVSDAVNGRFTFETLTAPTGNRLHFPGYDKFLKEIHSCIRHLQTQSIPTAVELADDEFILHVEGTASSQRVVRHIGSTSWPGRLTLTNYALYFEASGTVSYEQALKIDLSKKIEHNVRAAATGPWGAPLFDKAIAYESPEISEEIILEFPEMTSSTRRDHWLALIKEIILMHAFFSKVEDFTPTQVWEIHARTIFGIIRLHAAREMLRLSPPIPTKFLIFSLFDELPKGDIVIEELAESVKNINTRHPCSASSILKSVNVSQSVLSTEEAKKVGNECLTASEQGANHSLLETAITQVREEAKEAEIAKATAEGLKEEGISESAAVLMELLNPVKSLLPRFQEILRWERPAVTLTVLTITLIVVYKEWINKLIAACLCALVAKMLRFRKQKTKNREKEIVVSTASDKSTMENIVSAQYGMQTVHEIMQMANITILKIQSLLIWTAPKHSKMVTVGLIGLAMLLMIIPVRFILIGIILYAAIMTSKLGNYLQSSQGNRRLKEWWESIPVIAVHIVDKQT